MTRSLWFQVTAAAGFAALGVVTGIVATSDPEGHTHSHAAEPQQADAPVELSEIAQRNLGVEVAPIQPTRFVRTRAVAATIVEPPEASLPLFAPIGGRIRGVPVETGQVIAAGAVVAELVRDPIARPVLDLTKDVLAPAHEDRHEALVALRRARGELDIARAELERIEEFTRSSEDKFPVVPREREIELGYQLARAQLDYLHARHELERHGLSKQEVDAAADGAGLPPITAAGWKRALEHNGLWPDSADRLAGALPESARARPWVVATIAELAARGVDTAALATWFGEHPDASQAFVAIGVHLLTGASLADVDRLHGARAFQHVVPIAAPANSPWVRIRAIHARPGARVEPGDPIATLVDPQSLWLRAEPIGADVADVTAALAERRPCAATPLIEGDGTPLEVSIDYLTQEGGHTVAIAAVENTLLGSDASGPYRSWALRPGQLYTLHVPTGTVEDVIVLPIGALASDGARRIVFVREEDHFEPVEVRVLERDAAHVVIPSSGEGSLQAGAWVVHEGALALQLALAARAGGGHHHH